MQPANLYSIANCLEYLNAADAADGITGINLEQQRKSGHFHCLIEAIGLGLKQSPLNSDTVMKWHSVLRGEKAEVASPELQEFLREFNQALNCSTLRTSDAKIVGLAAELFCKFPPIFHTEGTHHRIERLLLSYLLSSQKRPIITFAIRDCDRFIQVHKSQAQMAIFLAEKIREKIIFQGEICSRLSTPSPDKATETYITQTK